MLCDSVMIASNGSLLKGRYESRVKWDLIQAYPERKSVESVPTLSSVQLHWSRREVGMSAESMSGAWTVLSLLSGCTVMPSIHRSSVSVASFRLREGDVTGVSVKLEGHAAWDFMDGFVLRVVPRFRPFQGFPVSCVDEAGSLTYAIQNALMFKQVESYYELFNPISSRPGFTITIQTKGADSVGELDGQLLRRSSIDLFTGLGVPMVA